ncbi:MAG: hypothetical protein WBG90_10850 [Saonia sp.]
MVVFIITTVACSKDDDGNEIAVLNSEGSMEEVRNFYNDSFVDTMVSLGFKVNVGNTPPSLGGTYLINPFVLENSNIPSDSDNLGEDRGEYLTTFSNQNNDNLTIDFSGVSGSGGQTDEGNGSFVTGANGTFTVYAKTTTQLGSAPATTAVVISGVITSSGIENVQFFGAMLDDNGDPQGVYISNNSGRIFIDGDGLASKQN